MLAPASPPPPLAHPSFEGHSLPHTCHPLAVPLCMHTFHSHSGRKITVDTTITRRYHHPFHTLFCGSKNFPEAHQQPLLYASPITLGCVHTPRPALGAVTMTAFNMCLEAPGGTEVLSGGSWRENYFHNSIAFLSQSLTMDFYSNCVLGDNTADGTQERMWASSCAATKPGAERSFADTLNNAALLTECFWFWKIKDVFFKIC